MVFGRVGTEAHAPSLWKASGSRATGAAVVNFAQFVAEAARFRGIQDTIAQDGFGPPGDASCTESTTLDSRLVDQEADWGSLSERIRQVQLTGSDQTPIPLTGWFRNGFGDVVEPALNLARGYARVMMLANDCPGYSKRRHLTGGQHRGGRRRRLRRLRHRAGHDRHHPLGRAPIHHRDRTRHLPRGDHRLREQGEPADQGASSNASGVVITTDR